MSTQSALATSIVAGKDYESFGVTFAGQVTNEVDETNLPEIRRSSTNNENLETSSVQLIRPPTLTTPKLIGRVASEVLAEWSGCVTSIQEEGAFFTATLDGVKGNGVKGQEEDANIPITDVAQWDRELLREGNFFRLCVIQGFDASGDPIRSTKVVFRRMPAYRQQDLERALERGRELAGRLRVE
jgi:hypothetical protein